MPEQLKQLIPIIIMLSFVILYVLAKMMFDRWRYAKEAKHKIQVMILHRAGQPDIDLKLIENIGGQSCVKIKTKNNADPIIHILGAPGEFPWVYPLGKSSFVQAGVQGIIFDEMDSEPLSNTTSLPIVSGQSFGSMAQSISLATSSAMQKSEMDDTPDGQVKKQKSGLKWVYVGLIIVGIIGVIGIALTAKSNGVLTDFYAIWKTTMGIK